MSDAGPMSDTAEPFEFTAPLSVCMDVGHPLAYLALHPVRTFAAGLGIDVDWLPFPAAGLRAPPAPADDRGTRHRRARAAYQASEIERYAAVQGIVIDDPFRSADTRPVCLAHLWLRHTAPDRVADFLAGAFAGHWTGTLDAADPAAVAAAVAAVGADDDAFRGFAAGPGAGELAALRSALVAAGVFTVPSLVAEGEVFVGRAHLPMVRWILSGRSGPPPI